MRKPGLRRDFTEEDGSYDFDGFEDAMGDYEDAERDRELEERMERTDERERMADHSDQEPKKALAEEYEEQYDEAMINDLKDVINDYLDGLPADTVNPDTIYEIVEAWSNVLPEVGDWCHDQVQSDIVGS